MSTMLCILDFEATCDPSRTFHPDHEIIEFPSVLLDQNSIPVSEFREFCKPLFNIKLTEFCKQLTGIEQNQVSTAADFPEVLKRHHEWLLEQVPELAAWEYGQKDEPPPVLIVTCGNWDLCTMLIAECRRWLLVPPSIYMRVVNIKDVFHDCFNANSGGMTSMLQYLELDLLGRHHSGIDDCRNIARIAQQLSQRNVSWSDRIQTIERYSYKLSDKESAKQRAHLARRLTERQ